MDQQLSEHRWHRANKITWFLQLTPFIRFVGVTGSMAYGVIKPNSDIDIFIIAKARRIWTTRAISRFLLRTIKRLRTGNEFHQRAGKICPNRYVSDKYLLINPQNRYHAQDYIQMVPLFDEKEYYKKFISANKWMEEYGYFSPRKVLNLVQSNTLNWIRHIAEWILGESFGDKVEKWFKKRELKIIGKEEPSLNQPGSSIVANDNEMRIHPRPFH